MTTSTFAAMSRCMCLCSGSGRASTVRRGNTAFNRQMPLSSRDPHAVADGQRALLPHRQLGRNHAVELFAVAEHAASAAADVEHDAGADCVVLACDFLACTDRDGAAARRSTGV